MPTRASIALVLLLLPIGRAWAQSLPVDARLARWRASLHAGTWAGVADSCARLLQWTKPALTAAEKASVLTLRATAFRLGGQPDSALALHRVALRLRETARGPAHAETGYSLLNIGNCLLELGLPDPALQALERSRRILERRFSDTDTACIPVYTSLGELHRAARRYPSAERYWDAAARIARKHYPAHAPQVAGAELNRATLLSETGRHDAAIALLGPLRQTLHARGDTLRADYLRALDLLATTYTRLGFPTKAIPLWETAVALGASVPACPPWLHGALRYNLGLCLLDLGDLRAAELNLWAALPYFAGDPFGRSRVWNGLGLAARYGGDPEQAAARFLEALNCNLERGPEHAPPFEQAGVYGNLGTCYGELGQFEAACYYSEKALRLLDGLPNTPSARAACALQLARMERQHGDFAAAKRRLDGLRARPPERDVPLAYAVFFETGQWHAVQNAPDEALRWYQKALEAIATGEGAFPYETVQVHVAIAEAHRLRARTGGDLSAWQSALRHVRQAAGALEALERMFVAQASVPEARHLFSRLFDLGVETALALGDARQAWYWSEAAKEHVLRRLAQQALLRATVTEHTAAGHARRRLAYFRQLRYGAATDQDVADLPGLVRLPAGLDDSIRLWTERCRRLEAEQTTGTGTPAVRPELGAVQRALAPHQTLLAYHWGAEQIALFVVRDDTFLCRTLPRTEALAAQIGRFYALCGTDPSWQTGEQFEDMARLGHLLYQKLVAPAAPWLRRELVIVPDALLCYLPFEALIVRLGSQAHRFRGHRYLLEEYCVGYAHAAGVWLMLRQRAPAAGGRGVLAVAPRFIDNPLGLAGLRHNVEEAERIRALWGGDLLENGCARETAFVRSAPEYRVFLLATHGLMHHARPEYSFVAFSQPADSTEGDNLLFVADICDLRLDADLVVLSACESATGRLYRGEGIVSLARAFQTAGARNVVASFWNVDDRQTPQITQDFFQYLKNGAGCFEALARARRDYLANAAGRKAHPYFWAGFTACGGGGTVAPAGVGCWPLAVGCLLLAVGCWLLAVGIRNRLLFRRETSALQRDQRKFEATS